MRVSADQADPGYTSIAGALVVYVDGQELPWAITADEETGEAWCYGREPDGTIAMDRKTRRAVIQKVTGKIEIGVDPRALRSGDFGLSARDLVAKYRARGE